MSDQPQTLADQQQLIADALDVLKLRGDADTTLYDTLRMAHTDHEADGGCTAHGDCWAVLRAGQICRGQL